MSEESSADSAGRKKTIAAVALLSLAAGILVYTHWPEQRFSTTKAYFSDDDGKTWYTDDIDNIPPYMHNGKEAVRINLYKTEKHPAAFAGYLTKFPTTVKDSIERQAKQKTPPTPAHEIAYAGEMPNQMLVKQPGKGSWEPIQSPAGVTNMTVAPPDDSMLDSVVP